MSGFTFDAGALIAMERRDRRVLAILARAKELGLRITLPATALAQAVRSPARQVALVRLMGEPGTDVVALDRSDAKSVGLLLARTGTTDIADAHVVLCALRAEQILVTSDPEDVKRIAPELELVVI